MHPSSSSSNHEFGNSHHARSRHHDLQHDSQSEDMRSLDSAAMAHKGRTGRMWPWLVTIFPFLVFHYPYNRPVYSKWRLKSQSNKVFFESRATENAPPSKDKPHRTYRMHAVRFTLLLVGALVAVCYIVYVCFSFNGGDSYPFMGVRMHWWVLLRNVVMIVLYHVVCVRMSKPNRERLTMMDFDMAKVDQDLAHVGVFHSCRKVLAFVTRRPFRMRWFTTFLSDNILLAVTFFCNIVHGGMKVVHDPMADRIVSYMTHVYRSCLLLGFIMYTLDFAPKVPRRRAYGYKGILLFAVSMNLADFFFHIGDSVHLSGFERAVGAGAQLFYTHSIILLLAIMGGHHMHAHASPDLPWWGLLKIALAMLVGALWLSYAAVWATDTSSAEYITSWVAESYVYVLWGLNVLGGLFCLIAAYFHAGSGREATLQLVKLGDHIASVENTGMDEETDQNLDFDVMLIVVTFVISSMFLAAEIFAAMSLGHYASMGYWVSAPVAPVGLSVLAAAALWRPPAKARFALYVGLFLAGAWLCSVEVAEDCHAHGANPACCEYPWVGDSRAEFETPHDRPTCQTTVGTHNEEDHCLAEIKDGSVGVLFSAVTETVTGVAVTAFAANGEAFFDEIIQKDEIIQTRVCREEARTILSGNDVIETTAGCYGVYLYMFPAEVASVCLETGCTLEVQTLNCAFVRSPPLKVKPLEGAGTEGEFVWQAEHETDVIESGFYSFYKVVGMAALLECFFTLFGVVFKLIVLSESRTESAQKSMRFRSRRSTTIFDAHEPERDFVAGQLDDVVEDISGEQSGGDPASVATQVQQVDLTSQVQAPTSMALRPLAPGPEHTI